MLEDLPIWTLVASLGALIGAVLGFTARFTRFCTLSAVETALYGGNWRQIRMWLLAIAVAALGTAILVDRGLVDLSETAHYLPRVAIAGPVIGGFLFGLGMSAVGTCGFGSILRVGGGDLRGLVAVIVIGLVGYMTIRGLLAIPRLTLIEPLSIPLPQGENASIGALFAMATGWDREAIQLPVAVVVSGALAVWCLAGADFRRNPKMVSGGVIVGLVVVAGWFVTGYIGADDFDPQPVESVSFVAAAGSAVIYLMTYTGSTVSFPVGLVAGVLVGSFLAAWVKHELRLEGFDEPREMRRHLGGAVLMGAGGVIAMGCSIGQGLSGVSTLAVPSFLALLSIWAGAAVGLRILIHGWPGFARA
ncbi:MAG: YeeE/YedE family protein [Alphaproteobacteria bacterium]|nr:YeeE/YedE family protein [Alphaproteobacteria bacterium]